jgi:hypothetical protein
MAKPMKPMQHLREINTHLEDFDACRLAFQADANKLKPSDDVLAFRAKLNDSSSLWESLFCKYEEWLRNAACRRGDTARSNSGRILGLIQIALALFACPKPFSGAQPTSDAATIILDVVPLRDPQYDFSFGAIWIARHGIMKARLNSALSDWDTFLAVLKIEQNPVSSRDGIVQFIYKPLESVINHTNGTVDRGSLWVEYTIDTNRASGGNVFNDINSNDQLCQATSRIIKETRTVYSMDDYDSKTRTLGEEAMCLSMSETSLSAADASLPMTWLRADGQVLCPALRFC